MRKPTKTEIAEHKAFRTQMQRNIDRTRRLAEKALAEREARERQAS